MRARGPRPESARGGADSVLPRRERAWQYGFRMAPQLLQRIGSYCRGGGAPSIFLNGVYRQPIGTTMRVASSRDDGHTCQASRAPSRSSPATKSCARESKSVRIAPPAERSRDAPSPCRHPPSPTGREDGALDAAALARRPPRDATRVLVCGEAEIVLSEQAIALSDYVARHRLERASRATMPDPEWVYFDFTSVAYRRDDPFGELLALFSLAPVFAMVAYATAIAARRDLQTLILLIGQVGRSWPRARARARTPSLTRASPRARRALASPQLANLALNLVLKKTINQARPAAHADSGVGGAFRTAGSSSGMPSNHAQFCTFLATCAALFIARRTRRPAMMKAFWVAGLWASPSRAASRDGRWNTTRPTRSSSGRASAARSGCSTTRCTRCSSRRCARGIARSRACAWFYIKDAAHPQRSSSSTATPPAHIKKSATKTHGEAHRTRRLTGRRAARISLLTLARGARLDQKRHHVRRPADAREVRIRFARHPADDPVRRGPTSTPFTRVSTLLRSTGTPDAAAAEPGNARQTIQPPS